MVTTKVIISRFEEGTLASGNVLTACGVVKKPGLVRWWCFGSGIRFGSVVVVML